MRYMLSASVGGKACPLTGRHRRGQCWGQLVRKTVRISELPHAALNRENSEFPASEKNRAPELGAREAGGLAPFRETCAEPNRHVVGLHFRYAHVLHPP